LEKNLSNSLFLLVGQLTGLEENEGSSATEITVMQIASRRCGAMKADVLLLVGMATSVGLFPISVRLH
jgi:hypothetical protein